MANMLQKITNSPDYKHMQSITRAHSRAHTHTYTPILELMNRVSFRTNVDQTSLAQSYTYAHTHTHSRRR